MTEAISEATARNHAHSVALHFMYYNFMRLHKSQRMTLAMVADTTTKLRVIGEVVDLNEVAEDARPKKRCPYKKR
ncbi:hypothetical protein [Nisaea sp.]|uniref:hypothetical protein n=1 Tax=Nisaea sp. TaxID=2024842 RepID=UPI003B51AA3F